MEWKKNDLSFLQTHLYKSMKSSDQMKAEYINMIFKYFQIFVMNGLAL